jgi:hypothetical protein
MQAQDPARVAAISSPLPMPATSNARGTSARRAAGIVLVAYLAVWAGLVAMLLSKPESFGEFGDPRLFGSMLVSVTLGAALLASLLWVGSRRLFGIVIGAVLLANGLSQLASFPGAALLPGGAGIALLYFAIKPLRTSATPAAAGATSGPSMLVLIGVPLAVLAVLGSFWLDQALRFTVQ